LGPGEHRQVVMSATIKSCESFGTTYGVPHGGTLVYSYGSTSRSAPFTVTLYDAWRHFSGRGTVGFCDYNYSITLDIRALDVPNRKGGVFWNVSFWNNIPVRNMSFDMELLMLGRKIASPSTRPYPVPPRTRIPSREDRRGHKITKR
jgi:hypothetical protein